MDSIIQRRINNGHEVFVIDKNEKYILYVLYKYKKTVNSTVSV